MNEPKTLPNELRYLQGFLRWLEKQPPAALDESLDISRLEKALRKRVRGLAAPQAQQLLNDDRNALQSWLDSWAPAETWAHWLLGALAHRNLARKLLERPTDEPPAPSIQFETPAGWHSRAIPFNLNLRKAKLRAFITAIDEFSFRLPYSRIFASGEGRIEEFDVQFGEVTGKKCLVLQTAPVQIKQVDYNLAVPGGFVSIMLCRSDGGDFDEATFEAQLPTLRIADRT